MVKASSFKKVGSTLPLSLLRGSYQLPLAYPCAMSEQAKQTETEQDREDASRVTQKTTIDDAEDDGLEEEKDEEEEVIDSAGLAPETAGSGASKKSKRGRIKEKLREFGRSGVSEGGEGSSSKQAEKKKLAGPALDEILQHNPALQSELGDGGKRKLEELVRTGDLADVLTGMVRT